MASFMRGYYTVERVTSNRIVTFYVDSRGQEYRWDPDSGEGARGVWSRLPDGIRIITPRWFNGDPFTDRIEKPDDIPAGPEPIA